MKYTKTKLDVIIPCYRGNELFKRAVKSIFESKLPVDRVFVSFNGNQSVNEQWLENFKTMISSDVKFIVFKSDNEITAKEHWLKICRNLTQYMDDETYIFLLAHDDIILDANNINVKDLYKEDATFFPQYILNNKKVNNHIKADRNYSIKQWLSLSFYSDNYTNMSGMIVKFGNLTNVVNEFKNKITGSRFEYMLATNYSITSVRYISSLNLFINVDPQSDGASISNINSRIDDCLYLRYLNLNVKFNFFERLVIYFRLIKKLSILFFNLVSYK